MTSIILTNFVGISFFAVAHHVAVARSRLRIFFDYSLLHAMRDVMPGARARAFTHKRCVDGAENRPAYVSGDIAA